jgi:hypothetical protein
MRTQEQQKYNIGYVEVPESRQEGVYRKILVALVIVLMAESVLYRIGSYLYSWFGMSNELLVRPLNWIGVFVWGGLPLMIGLILPKKHSVRIPLIVIGSLYALWHVGTFIRDTLLYRDQVYF